MNPELGRFISEDPAADPNNPNLYVYCASNPINRVDPSGMEWYNNWDDFKSMLGGWFGWNNGNSKKSNETKSNSNTNSSTTSTTNNGTVTSNNNQVTVKDSAGNTVATYNKEEMKADLQKLAQMQQEGSPGAQEAERSIKNKYKAFFDATKGSEGITVIGLRGWGKGTNIPASGNIKGETNGYDDMLLVMDQSGNLSSFSEVNFEGSTATGSYYSKKLKRNVTLDGANPSIIDDTYTLNKTIHSGYDALSLENNGEVPTTGTNPNWPKRNPPYADGVHIHKGGAYGWNYSEGCITIRDARGQWERFISYLPSGQAEGTQVGTFKLMSL